MTVELASLRESLAAAEHDKAALLARFNGYGEQLQRQQQELVDQVKASVAEKIRGYQAQAEEARLAAAALHEEG